MTHSTRPSRVSEGGADRLDEVTPSQSKEPLREEISDATLVRRALAGEGRAFDRLVERHFRVVHYIAFARIGDQEIAEDLAQEVFLRAFLALRRLRRPARFRAWVQQIARNLSANWLRDNITSPQLVKLVPLGDVAEDLPDLTTRGAPEMLQSDQESTAVRGAISELPEELREVVLLHYVEEMNQSQIGRLLGLHSTTVGRQLERGRSMMRETLAPLLRASRGRIRPRPRAVSQTLTVIAAAGSLSPAARAAIERAAGDLAAQAAEEIGISSSLAQSLHGVWEKLLATAGGKRFTWPTAGAVLLALGSLLLIPRESPPIHTNSLGMRLRLIPAGSFEMGSPPEEANRTSYEGPVHTVTVQPFHLAETEVTVAQYARFLEATGFPPPQYWETHQVMNPQLPVLTTRWQDAVAFCEWLSSVEGMAYSLPTEAQWEYACRAGTTSPYHFGESLGADFAKFDPEGGVTNLSTPDDVGSYPPNAWGLFDMHGNAFEWCLDKWHPDYAGAPTDGSVWEGAPETPSHVVRGGSFWTFPHHCRSAYRNFCGHPNSHYDFGFRVAAAVE